MRVGSRGSLQHRATRSGERSRATGILPIHLRVAAADVIRVERESIGKLATERALIAEARKRISDHPGDYYPRIYGIREVGGTSVLMLSAVPFEQLGLRTGLPGQPLPGLTWAALEHVPDVVSVGSVLLGGIWWITHRREEVARAECPAKGSNHE